MFGNRTCCFASHEFLYGGRLMVCDSNRASSANRTLCYYSAPRTFRLLPSADDHVTIPLRAEVNRMAVISAVWLGGVTAVIFTLFRLYHALLRGPADVSVAIRGASPIFAQREGGHESQHNAGPVQRG
jgi:hypothetical protein